MWTVDLMAQHLDEAAGTLRRLPSLDARFFNTMRAVWPDTLPETWYEAFQRTSPKHTRTRPSAEQIARLDRALEWTAAALPVWRLPAGMPADTSKILWCRAAGFSWNKIIALRRPDRNGAKGRHSLRMVEVRGLQLLVAHVEAAGIPPARIFVTQHQENRHAASSS